MPAAVLVRCAERLRINGSKTSLSDLGVRQHDAAFFRCRSRVCRAAIRPHDNRLPHAEAKFRLVSYGIKGALTHA